VYLYFLKFVSEIFNLLQKIGGHAPRRRENKSPEHLIVDILHKQGPMVISREDLKYSGGKKV